MMEMKLRRVIKMNLLNSKSICMTTGVFAIKRIGLIEALVNASVPDIVELAFADNSFPYRV